MTYDESCEAREDLCESIKNFHRLFKASPATITVGWDGGLWMAEIIMHHMPPSDNRGAMDSFLVRGPEMFNDEGRTMFGMRTKFDYMQLDDLYVLEGAEAGHILRYNNATKE